MHEALPEFLIRLRASKALALASVVAAAAAVLVLVAKLVWLLASIEPEIPLLAPVATLPSAGRSDAPLASWHLFGNAAPAADPRALAEAAPDTSLRLVLRGIFAQDDPKAGHAIVADENGVEQTYRVGAEVAPGVVVDAVHADRVMLSRAGALETLRLPRRDEGPPVAAPLANARGPRGVNVAPGSAAAASTPGASLGGPAFVAPNVDWNAATQKLGVDPRRLAQSVQVLPVMENGAFVGVRLSGGREAAALAKLGLKPDDIVTSVNGIPLDSFSRAQAVASSFENASSVSVTVKRGGKTETLSVSLR